MSSIDERFRDKFRKSGELFAMGSNTIAGRGHMSRVIGPHPLFVEEAQGAIKLDADGNELIDYQMGYGALILGNAHPEVTKAVADQLSKGTHFTGSTRSELRWAELVQSLIPSAERVRFTASGTESTLLALRLARGYTGKTKLIKFREHFHGWHDYVARESGINTEVGIPEESLSTVLVVDPDIEALGQALEQNHDVAAVIMEPTGGHWGQFPVQNPQFLEDVRELTSKHGVVMIMDEVICGFRMSRGGAQGRFDVLPDLTTMAKIVAGGLPGGAVAGRADILDQLSPQDPSDRIAHPGTYNANPVSAAAGIAALDLVANEPINERADAMAARLKRGLTDAMSKLEVNGHVHGLASIVHLALGVECECGGDICTTPHSELAEATAGPKAERIKLAMLNESVDMMGGIGFMVSAAHTEDQVDRTVGAFERALPALRDEQLV